MCPIPTVAATAERDLMRLDEEILMLVMLECGSDDDSGLSCPSWLSKVPIDRKLLLSEATIYYSKHTSLGHAVLLKLAI